MKDYHGVERSAGYLRQALPLMSRQTAGLHPYSYAVWYEYVAEINVELREAVDAALASQGRLDEACVRSLYHQYIAESALPASDRLAEGVDRLLESMSESAESASHRASRYGASLGQLRDTLSSESPERVGEVLKQTQDMQTEVERLRRQLENSRREIGDLRREVQAIRQESLVDPLTSVANRRAFDQRLLTCLLAAEAAGTTTSVSLILIDIDHFKRINDTYGHGFGDQVLKAVAQVLKALCHQDGLAARIGGEEFALLLPGMPLEDARMLAESVRTRVAASRIRRSNGDELARVTVSLGVTAMRAGDTAPSLLDRSDAAMYAAKGSGRDRVCVNE